MHYQKIIDLLLRVCVAFAFLYPPVNAFLQPDAWVGYIPAFVGVVFNPEFVLHFFGVLEVGLALWILSGWKIMWPSLAAAGVLVGIVLLNMPQFQVLFRDLSIAAAAVALALMHRPRNTSRADIPL